MELSGNLLMGQMKKISQALGFFQLNGLCNYGTLLPMQIFFVHEKEIVKLTKECAKAAKRRIQDRTTKKEVPGMKAVHALRRELKVVWGTTLTRQRDDQHTRTIGFVYNKVKKVEELALKRDFVPNLIKLHTTHTINTTNEECAKKARKD